jgi:putative aldouronate transport system permease protein
MVNYVLTNFLGFQNSIYFLGTPAYFRGTLVVTEIWKTVGWSSILYLAAIAGIDPGLYEAAICDGAKRWHRIWYITLPALAPTITILLILNIGGILDAGFDQVFNLYNPAVYSTGDIIDTYAYRYGIERMQYAFSTAVSLFKNGIGFVLVVGSNAIARKIGDSGIW